MLQQNRFPFSLRIDAMRWPLRYQILLPMVGVMLFTILGVSVLNALFSVRRERERIEGQLRKVAYSLANEVSSLNELVLNKASELSGAELTVTDHSGSPIASSWEKPTPPPVPWQTKKWNDVTLGKPVRIGDQYYFHAAVQLGKKQNPDRAYLVDALKTTGDGADSQAIERALDFVSRIRDPEHVLHIFYPEQSWRDAWWQSVQPPLWVGSSAIVLMIFLAMVIALRVSRPIRTLREQVDKIARGDFRPVPTPRRNDEIRDLAASVSHMSEMLASYEDEVRRSERLRTLGQLGGGIAHQMRNTATGCRMALDLHRAECSLEKDSESLDVAVRQLELMERYLRRFLSLGSAHSQPHTQVDLVPLVKNVLPLVRPAANHVGVEVQCHVPGEPVFVHGDHDALEQLLVNLLLNAIDAASRRDKVIDDQSPQGSDSKGTVVVQLARSDDGRVLLEVLDSGKGPAAEVQENLFEPLVTEKPDGTGLGLTLSRQIVQEHHGTIDWKRKQQMTCFTVELPTFSPEDHHGTPTRSG